MMIFLDMLLQLPLLAGIVILMALTTLVGVTVYLGAYRLFANSQSKEVRRASEYLFRSVGILLSLFLSLTFADVMLELNAIETSIEREAIMIEDIHRDLDRYGSTGSVIARSLVVDYLRAVIDHDWPALANDRLSPETTELFSNLENQVLHLEDHSELQGILRSRIIADVDAVSDLRLSRLEHALAGPPLFLSVVVFGFIISMICFSTHKPTRVTLFFLSLYALLIGLVIYLILAYSDPYQGATGIEPASLEFVLKSIEGTTSGNRPVEHTAPGV